MTSSGLPFEVEEDAATRTLTVRLTNAGVPSFTIALLEALDALFARWRAEDVPADALIFASATPATFSMGGDLATIAALARTRDRATLHHYAHVSARVVHALWTGLGRDLITIGAVDGKAFGSGFEAIVACTLAVAAPGARFAFPEARFGLFPGMGATSLLGRRASPALAESLILSGRHLTAPDAKAIGAVDILADIGDTAEACARRLATDQTAKARRLRADARTRRRSQPYPLDEAYGVVDVWVDAVLTLSDDRIAEIERIARMQLARSRKKKEINAMYAGTDGRRPALRPT